MSEERNKKSDQSDNSSLTSWLGGMLWDFGKGVVTEIAKEVAWQIGQSVVVDACLSMVQEYNPDLRDDQKQLLHSM
jgi:hypothetical protein